MKKLLMLSILLSTIITVSCKSTPKKEIVLPPKPQRQELEVPTELKDYALIIVYYDCLVEEWEAWGNTVTEIIEESEK